MTANLKTAFLLLFIALSFNNINANEPYKNTSLPVDERVNDLISRMTLAEKIAQLGHKSAAISRLGVASYNYWNEAIHGVARAGLATSFPVSIALSSTWNPELVYQVASVTADEARIKNNIDGKGLTYWSPTINLARDPRWGRSEENYGEDVFLTTQIAVNFIKGLQGNDPNYLKTVATVKHFAANNIEKNRYGISSDMDERNLREYYLPAFKACVTEGKVASLMSAYNAVNGVPSPANRTLLDYILRQEWGFNGFVVSDCDAAKNVWDSHYYVATAPEATAISLKNGNDLNCGTTFPESAATAIENGLMHEQDIDKALRNIFKARFLLGEFDPTSMVPYKAIPANKLDCQEHRDLALKAAHESIVMLKNQDSFLPLNKENIRTIAVIGPNASAVQLGGYSGSPAVAVSALQGIADKMGIDISMGIIEAENFSDHNGIRTEVCNEGGSNVGYITNGKFIAYNNVDFGPGKTKLDIRVASQTAGGSMEIVLGSINGQSLAKFEVPGTGSWQVWQTLTFEIPKTTGIQNVYMKFTGASGYLFNINWFRFYNQNDVDPTAGNGPIRYAQGCTVTGAKVQSEFDNAVAIAKSSDMAIVVLGTDLSVADESRDRSNITLPGVQEQLLKEVYRANPNTVLVLVTGASLAVNWAQDSIPAILCTWYNGQAQGTALADVLFGQYNPKGKLSSTWYKSLSDLTNFDDYNIRNNRTYMYFKGTALYPFGYGLSYTTFDYKNLNISSTQLKPGDSIMVSANITNTGQIAGHEVVQLYVNIESSIIERPIKELKGFASVYLEPGQSKTVSIVLKHEALSYYNENDKAYLVESGKVNIMLGASSADIRLRGSIDATEGLVANTYRRNPFEKIEAETFEYKTRSVKPVAANNGTQSLAGLSNNSVVAYKNLDFSSEPKQFVASLASSIEGASIEIVLDSLNGIPAGTLAIDKTGSIDDFKTQTCELSHLSGVRDVYLVFKTSSNDALRLNWIRFDQNVSKEELNPASKKTGFKIYPNPAGNNFSINYQLNGTTRANLKIYNIQGKLLKTYDLQQATAGVFQAELSTDFAPTGKGIYVARFSSGNFSDSMIMEIKK